MIILALDSTTADGSYALSLREDHLEVHPGDPSRSWSQRLPGDLVELLSAHGRRILDVDVFAAVSGPGSMTGLRVGIATIQGLAFASGRRVAAASALDVLCAYVAPLARSVSPCALAGAWLNAMRGEVFAQLCEPGTRDDEDRAWTCLDGPHVELPSAVSGAWRQIAGDRPIVVVGNETLPQSAALQEAFGQRLAWRGLPMLAGVLVPIARRLAARGALVSPHAVRPNYVRRPDAELARERTRDAASPESAHR